MQAFFAKLVDVLAPVLYGMCMAYLLAPIVNWLERGAYHLRDAADKKKGKSIALRQSALRAGSILLTWVGVLLLLYLLFNMLIPQLVDIEEDPEIEGLLVILNTVGGDVEAGLALAELIAGVSKPSATLVLGGGHSIGIPLAVAARHSFIVPTATMTVHPVRHSGMVLGVPQTLRYFEQMQERIVSFVTEHSKITARRFTQLMHNTGELVMDMGTVLDGRQAVEEGLIDELGGLRDALGYLYKEIEK